MPEKHREYLAANILSDGRIASASCISHTNELILIRTPRFLYEFHQQENIKKPGSVHATYLLAGVRKPPPAVTHQNGTKHDEDEEMKDSSFMMSSSMPQPDENAEKIVVQSITLVREDELENARAAFDTISSIHVYSLQPHALKDLQVLSNVNREVYSQYTNEDPLEVGRQYGTIINPNVKRRSGRRPPVVPQAPVSSKSGAGGTGKENKSSKTEPTESSSRSNNAESKTKDQSTRPSQNKAENASFTKPPAMKRGDSNIFKAFAKARPKGPKEDTDSSAAASAQPSAPEDEPMKDASEEEQEEDLILPTSTKTAAEREAESKAKAQREEQLRQMMEVDDEDPSEPAASKEQSPENQASPAMTKEVSPPAPTKPGRRRGRRKVMKKVTTKDDEGYLVTKEEAAWESFSEDEPAPKSTKTKMTPASAQSSSAPGTAGTAASKSKKGKAGQGDIKSFFSKR
ncbi:MAG: hypothetical protein M1816_001395 [Peltula sp. TS41687]|nr:MAG: hypothetical protein M1816_001395 [Peltula sp. TS41687]